jgi:hypothetical protein
MLLSRQKKGNNNKNNMKQCGRCKQLKTLDCFSVDNSRPSGYQSRCRTCDYEAHKEWKLKKYGPTKPRAKYIKYKTDDERIEAQRNRRRMFQLNLTDEQRKKEKIARNKRDAIKLQNPFHKAKENLRCSALNGFKNGYNAGTQPHILFGCTHEELKNHIELQFEPWMNWSNRGFGVAGQAQKNYHWQLDHIKPLNSATNLEEYIALWHYTNIRPLCAYANGVIRRGMGDPKGT